MANLDNAFRWECLQDHWHDAKRRALVRLETSYKRDERLDDNQRLEKIAIGYLGEFAFSQWVKSQHLPLAYLGNDFADEPDHGDFRSMNGLTIDVKTQEIFVTPQPEWRCEVTDGQLKRPIDIYVFAKLLKVEDVRTVWITGWLSKPEFKQAAIYRQPGTLLKNKPVHYPKWDVTIAQLNDLEQLVNVVKEGLPNA